MPLRGWSVAGGLNYLWLTAPSAARLISHYYMVKSTVVYQDYQIDFSPCMTIALCFSVAVALAIVKPTFSQTRETYIYNFKIRTRNASFQVPYRLPTTLAYFNSVFNIFWTTHSYSVQAGSTAFPSQTLWILNVSYQQSNTIYVTMSISPYTRNKRRVQGSLYLIITAWWAQSWARFSIITQQRIMLG